MYNQPKIYFDMTTKKSSFSKDTQKKLYIVIVKETIKTVVSYMFIYTKRFQTAAIIMFRFETCTYNIKQRLNFNWIFYLRYALLIWHRK